MAADGIGTRDFADQRLGERAEPALFGKPGQDGLELVAAEPADLPDLPQHPPQPVRDLGEELVADRVAGCR